MPARSKRPLDPTLDNNDSRVITFVQWCQLNGFSIGTGKRIRQSGNGPKFIQLSAKRVGVRLGDNRAWQQARITT